MIKLRALILIMLFYLAIAYCHLTYMSAPDKIELEFEIEVIKREEWGALEPRCEYDRNPYINAIIIHRTATSNKYVNARRVVKSIQLYHMFSRGWCDIGYHFLMDKDGNIYEGWAYLGCGCTC